MRLTADPLFALRTMFARAFLWRLPLLCFACYYDLIVRARRSYDLLQDFFFYFVRS
jgi:hypothetical protein